jgi:hypothetical protein
VLGVSGLDAAAGLGVGVDVGVEVGSGAGGGGTGVRVGVAVAVQVGAGGLASSWSGRRMMVGSGGTSWPPHADSRNTIATAHSAKPIDLANLTQHPLLVAQRIDGVEARRSKRRIEAENHPHYQGEGRGQSDGLHGDHSHHVL